VVLAGSLAGIVLYGLWRGRGSDTTQKYLLAGKTMPWYAMALSIMATQASAITFISTTGQSYVDGMRFVQFYFGLPLAMIVIAAFVAPRFHASGVYTAYEYLERRFDGRTSRAGERHLPDPARPGGGRGAVGPGTGVDRDHGLAWRGDDAADGADGDRLHGVGRIAAVTWTDFVQMLVMTLG
jgi:Na+/proline symporter